VKKVLLCQKEQCGDELPGRLMGARSSMRRFRDTQLLSSAASDVLKTFRDLVAVPVLHLHKN